MKVLITGADGQLGRTLVKTAPIDTCLTAYPRAKLDISDRDAIEQSVAALEPDVIINCAAYTSVDRAENERQLAQRVNADGSRYLADAARQTRAHLVHVSTDFVFDGDACIPYKPEAITNPLSVYGATKRAGEIAVLDTLPTRSFILRTSWVYASAGNNFVRTMLRLMRDNRIVRVVADQIGTPTSTQSLALALWAISNQPQIVGIHHWTDAGIASWYDFAIAIAEEAAALRLLSTDVVVTPIATRDYPTAAQRPRYSVLDTTSLDCLSIERVHWRKRLRNVLSEIANV